jgi:hypothetical protein
VYADGVRVTDPSALVESAKIDLRVPPYED